MEYHRKNRWANYGTIKCKEYLRNDFSHECAYCKIQEKEVGLVDSAYFEIDHFRPQSDDDPKFNPHLYNNLYYSCEKCNSEKSDTWSKMLLDPCQDEIFSGSNPPILGGYNPEFLYKYKGANDRGEFYINTFKLNSRHHIRIRKRRVDRNNNIRIIDKLVDEILQKFSNKKDTGNLHELIKQLDNLRLDKKRELSKLSENENFELVEEHLLKHNIKSSIVFEEYNMDIKIKVGEYSCYCELCIDDSQNDKEEKLKFIDKERLETWYKRLSYKFGILYYYPKLDKLYFYPISNNISKDDLSKFGTKKQIKLTSELLI
ncbi:hypothetical protein HBE96_24910 [Clostridium sp. P21]|uniref:HNH domain-containing protein n=1 Tax=Clostridium muellerianum TaxID=2716538 RepID=A0A7Y0HRI4_9CLOT|nr:HNH endonuclease [Clostridium muellerianum]NMM65822.1 hypothetical protein [Clostridium muellerianum]